MEYRIVIVSSLGALAVGLGAFGAHGLENKITTEQLEIWRTAVLYHFIHLLFMLFLVLGEKGKLDIRWPFYFALAGVTLFSGSLYLLAIKDLFTNLPTKILGPITPIGGIFFILAWLSLIWSIR